MCLVPSHERLESEAKQASAFPTYPGLTMAVNQHGLYGSPTDAHDYLLVVISCLT